jgi:hypothetical protein
MSRGGKTLLPEPTMLLKIKVVGRIPEILSNIYVVDSVKVMQGQQAIRAKKGNQKNSGRSYDVDENKARFFRVLIDPTMLLKMQGLDSGTYDVVENKGG